MNPLSQPRFLLVLSLLLLNHAQGDVLSISGSNLSTISDSDGNSLTPGSIIQVGYFLGINPASTDPSEFGASQWNTFTPLTGPGSLNPGLTAVTENIGSFEGVYRLDQVIDDVNGGPDASTFPPFPAIAGVRIFDTTDPLAIGSADFNTVSTTLDSWIATGRDGIGGTGLVLGLNPGGSNPGSNDSAFWQFSSSPFQTAIPEPSSSLALLLGTSLLLLRRTRSEGWLSVDDAPSPTDPNASGRSLGSGSFLQHC